MNLPNSLTMARLLAVPLVVWLIATGEHLAAFVAFVLAGATDALDGTLARALDQRTRLGACLDAVADKSLIAAIYVTLALTAHLPASLAALVVMRDALIVAGVLVTWLLGRPIPIEPSGVSKANTFVQIAFAALMLGARGFGWSAPAVEVAGAWLVGALTLWSAAAYLATFIRHNMVAGARSTDG
ncbi:CDP-alcohol phosphatidyltransferase family protein [Hansschlegelia beijingensis]|uniref:CDP-alcohol phosphatidyltransferase family protein n=1 Tax=Hansschlegelia beijingensis TaxID=1133344 RepID=UPI00387EF833